MNKSKSILVLAAILLLSVIAMGQLPPGDVKIETSYDAGRDKTTVRMAPFKVSDDNDKYHSLHIAPSFSYAGTQPKIPSTIDFEIQTVVKGKLRKNLYVVFVVDGETIFLSSNRWGISRPVPGRSWMGERLVFNMPHETLLKIASAKSFAIKMDAVSFEFGEEPMQALRDLSRRIQSPELTK